MALWECNIFHSAYEFPKEMVYAWLSDLLALGERWLLKVQPQSENSWVCDSVDEVKHEIRDENTIFV